MKTLAEQIYALLNHGDKLNENLICEYEAKLIKIYKATQRDIQSVLAEMYKKYGDDVTYADMRMRNRLLTINNEISQVIQELKPTSEIIKNSILTGYEGSYAFTGYTFEKTIQVDLGFIMPDKSVVQAALYNPLEKIKWSTRNIANIADLNSGVKNAIVRGLVEGSGYSKTAGLVDDELNIGVNKAARIVWTETHRAQQTGRLTGLDESLSAAKEFGIQAVKHWMATLDNRTRPNHGHMESVEPNEKGKFLFTTMTGKKILVDGPGMTGTTDDINCRCTLSMRFLSIPIVSRIEHATNKTIAYKSYDDWRKNKYGG